ncbi:MAG: p-hydroxybenzoic acid efflux pump subunit AaeB [Pseudomonas citronellolis]|nr:MAG: p-hydroxybenzoic acid efflux pump subunit AaeB [Pseudomonas citronellolis]
MPKRLSEFFQVLSSPHRTDLQFASKSILAGALALYLAFRFELHQPQWSLVTVFVVSQPWSGMVLAKSAFRLLGTLVGALASVVIVATLGQAPIPFLLAMAAWLAFCTAGASLLHNFSSYGFVLAGYTAAIIALPSSADPLSVFDQAVARCSEIGLGILCASLVSLLLWPRRLARQLGEQGKGAWEAGLQAAAAHIAGRAEHEALMHAMGRIVAVDGQREHAWFEGPLGRRRAQGLRVLNADLLSLLRAARKVARDWHLLSASAAASVQPWRERVCAVLDSGETRTFQPLREQVLDALPSLDDALARQCLQGLAQTLAQAHQAQRSLESLVYGEVPRQVPGVIVWHRDIERGVLFGLRSALAFLCVAAFWIVTAWPSGLGAVSITGVVLSLFASRENPASAGFNFLRGIVLSIPLAGIAGLVILPLCDGFAELYVVLGVPLFLASLCMSRPALAATASAFCIFYVKNVAPSNLMTYDLARFLNSALATVLGVGFAVLVFHLVRLQPGRRHYRRVMQAILADLARLTQGPLPVVEGWFDGRSADRLLRLAQYYRSLPENRRARWRGGLLGLELGDELLCLRTLLADARGPLRRAREAYLARLRRLLLEGGPQREHEWALESEQVALLIALQGNRWIDDDRRLQIRASLSELANLWARWCRREVASSEHIDLLGGALG